MKIGVTLRIMGPQSTAETLTACAKAADEAGLDDLWVADHVAIPPDDSEGSGGRYLDPLTALGFLAAHTERIGIGTAVLNLPYRPALPTAKQIATVQELSGGRLRLGVGVGWMEAEFRALGVDRTQRGRLTDETLTYLKRCFADDVMEANGQDFLFLPRPRKPPIFVGGLGRPARERAIRHGDGWLPISRNPEKLGEGIRELQALAEEAGRSTPEVAVLTPLPLDDGEAAADRLREFAEVGVGRVAHTARYESVDDFRREIERLMTSKR